jgi:dTDP-4-dehydrorhamnose 3,5-epimerase
MKQLTLTDIDASVRGKVSGQHYEKPKIGGVEIISLPKYLAEDGSFTELFKLNEQGNMLAFPDFHIAQVNRSVMLPGTIKAWHLHFGQDEVWNVGSRTHLLLGLWDIRETSPTKGKTMRIPLNHDKLVLIPRGVAHGAANHMTHAAEILYFVSSHYNRESPDEQRLPWDAIGKEFWEIKRE